MYVEDMSERELVSKCVWAESKKLMGWKTFGLCSEKFNVSAVFVRGSLIVSGSSHNVCVYIVLYKKSVITDDTAGHHIIA